MSETPTSTEAGTASTEDEEIAVPSPPRAVVRHRLRFDALEGFSIPPDYLLIDEALDLVGEYIYPGSWGYQTDFDQLPFWTHKGVFARMKMRKRERGWRRVYYRVKPHNADKFSLNRLHRQFWMVAQNFSFGNHRGHFDLFYADQSQGILPEPLGKGVIYFQRNHILLLGRGVPPGFDEHTRPLPILVDRPSFMRWLVSPLLTEWSDRDDDEPTAPGKKSAISSYVVETLVAFLQKHKLRATRKGLFDAISEAAKQVGRTFSDNEFDRRIWDAEAFVSDRGLKVAGRPKADDEARWDSHLQLFIKTMRVAFER